MIPLLVVFLALGQQISQHQPKPCVGGAPPKNDPDCMPAEAYITLIPSGPRLNTEDGRVVLECKGWWKDCHLGKDMTLDDVAAWIRHNEKMHEDADEHLMTAVEACAALNKIKLK